MAHMRPHVLLGVTATELRSYVSLFCRLFPLLFTSFVPGLFFRSWDHGIFFLACQPVVSVVRECFTKSMGNNLVFGLMVLNTSYSFFCFEET